MRQRPGSNREGTGALGAKGARGSREGASAVAPCVTVVDHGRFHKISMLVRWLVRWLVGTHWDGPVQLMMVG